MAEYDEAIRLDPKLAQTYCNRRVIYNENNEFDKAIADFDKAIEQEPNRVRGYVGWGEAYREKGEL